MRFDEFLDEVEYRARLGSREDALHVTHATLETLARRLAGDEPCHLGGQLPPEVARLLVRGEGGQGEAFNADEFLRRVCHRAGRDLTEAERHARSVLAVLRAAAGPGEVNALLGRLPADFRRLFDEAAERPPPS